MNIEMYFCVFCKKDLATGKTIELREKESIGVNNEVILYLLGLDRSFMRNADALISIP